MRASRVSFGDVISNFSEIVRSRLSIIAIAIVSVAALYTVIDLAQTKSIGFIPNILVSIFGQYLFIEAILFGSSRNDLSRKRRFGSLFSAGILSGLGILVGLLLLVLPGIFLIARWSASSAYVVAEDMSGSEALRASWDATDESRWPLFFVYLLGCVIFGLLFCVTIFGAGIMQVADDSLAFSIVSNIAVSILVVGGWILGVAVFRCIGPAPNDLETVFA
jgi:hypothetical protein